MKSYAIVTFIGAMFVVISGFMPVPAKPYIVETVKNNAQAITPITPAAITAKKTKSNRLPHWHRVIPGMIS